MKEIYKPTPFMTADTWVINDEIVYVEIPIDWAKVVK